MVISIYDSFSIYLYYILYFEPFIVPVLYSFELISG